MRNTLIFAGSSCPQLTNQICSNLGMAAAPIELTQFANGETSVKIMTSIREKDVFVVQSGSAKINDSIMELLIMISACKGGSANKITAVLPYFPYSRQSKKKSHRGAITARMLANLLDVAGVHHVVTIDLHASQMQGFFKCPVDNLHAEPLIARWIRHNVPEWREAVCVSKNAGGTKRVTSLADALKLNFGMVTTDRRRGMNMTSSMIMARLDGNPGGVDGNAGSDLDEDVLRLQIGSAEVPRTPEMKPQTNGSTGESPPESNEQLDGAASNKSGSPGTPVQQNGTSYNDATHSRQNSYASTFRSRSNSARSPLSSAQREVPRSVPIEEEKETTGISQYTDERAREVTHGRLVQGHIVPDDYPSPTHSAMSSSAILETEDDPMSASRTSSYFDQKGGLGGTADAAESDEEEQDPGLEQMITLVGDVRGRTVFIVDDMIDKAGSWIAAAETVVKRGGAKTVYIIATHGLFGGDSLQQLQQCDCIDSILVTNSFPIPPEKSQGAKKLQVLDLSNLLSEAIRRNHYGESISALFSHNID